MQHVRNRFQGTSLIRQALTTGKRRVDDAGAILGAAATAGVDVAVARGAYDGAASAIGAVVGAEVVIMVLAMGAIIGAEVGSDRDFTLLAAKQQKSRSNQLDMSFSAVMSFHNLPEGTGPKYS